MEEEKEKKIKYEFVAVPLNLFCRLDNNLRSMLFTLIQLQTYYAEDDGWFYRSNADLGAQSNLSENLVRITIDTLYKEGIIDVESVGKGKGANSPSNRFKVNWERFKEYENDDIESCIKDPRLEIVTPKYKGSHYRPSYLDKNNSGSEPHGNTEDEGRVDGGVMVADTTFVEDEVDSKVNNVVTNVVKVEDNIYNINNLNNIDNKKNIDNIENKDNNNKIIDNIDINYDIYKDRITWYKSLPSEMLQSDFIKERMIFELYQLHDIDSIEKKIDEIEKYLYRRRGNDRYIEKTKYILNEKSNELGFKFSTILN